MAGGSGSVRRGQNEEAHQELRRRKHGMRLRLGASGGRMRHCQKLFSEELEVARPARVGGGGRVVTGGGGGEAPPSSSSYRVSARKLAASKWAEIELSTLAPPFAAPFRPPPLPPPPRRVHPLHPSDASPSACPSASPRSHFPSLPSSHKPRIMFRKSPRLRTDFAISPDPKSIAVTQLPRHGNFHRNLNSQYVATKASPHGMDAAPQVAALVKKSHAGEVGLASSKDDIKAFNRLRDLGEQQSGHTSVVSALRKELELARVRLQKLHGTQKSARKEVDVLLERCANESITLKNREQKNVQAAALLIGKQLEQEIKTRKELEVHYREQSRNLSEVNKATTKAMNELDKEKKGRQLKGDICDDLARKIGADKAEFEKLKRDHAKMKDEIKLERMMFQTAEVWREERVQIKFSDARLELEERSLALDKLRAELEAFLSCRRTYKGKGDLQQQAEANQAEMLREAVEQVQEQTARSVRSMENTICQPA